MTGLFPDLSENNPNRPLADRMRPQTFDDVLGQGHLLDDGALFADTMVRTGKFSAIIFWGTPGCGKTTMARLIAKHVDGVFVSISAITSATAELRKIFDRATDDKQRGRQTVLLADEIHRFNRAQHDLFLPFMEDGTIILVGATTQNPSFELNSALLSRCKVLTLHPLEQDDLIILTRRAEEFTGHTLPITEDARETLCALADGDARYLLGCCEDLFSYDGDALDSPALLQLLGRRAPVYDKSQDGHYNLLSAFHKSLRGSDVDAALYWAARMIDGGEDPPTILRRIVACAAEDVGMADPQALVQALAAKDAYEYLGWPEARQSMAQAIIYIASAPKSNAAYAAMNQALAFAKKNPSQMPPPHALNAPTKMMKEQGYSAGYIYDHNTEHGFSGLSYFPEGMKREAFYHPVERGFEREISKRMEYFAKGRKGE